MDCTVIGDIFFDVIVPGLSPNFQIVQGGVSFSDSIKLFAGGAGNIAVGLTRLGGTAQFIGKAGRDEFGNIYKNILKKENVKSNILFDNTYPTGITISFIGINGERSFLLSRGANDHLTPEEIEHYEREILQSNYLYISGYSLVKSPQKEAILKAVEIAKSGDTKVLFDPGAHNLISEMKIYFDKIINMSDIIAPNLEEAIAIVNSENIHDIFEYLSERVPLIALKMGDKGCIIKTYEKMIRCKGYKMKCVDTTGAGDAFVSALIYGLSKKMPLKKIANLANWYAAYNVQFIGARSYPNQNTISNYLKKYSTNK